MNVFKKSLLVFTTLLWGTYGTLAMQDDGETGRISPHFSPEVKYDQLDEYERSNGFKSFSVEKRDFVAFKAQCEKNSEPLVMVFGAHSGNGHYKNNVYKVDLVEDCNPDLLMHTDIAPLPKQYIGQFDVVVFECITSSETDCKNYERAKAFPNVNKLLKDNGLFLVWTDNRDDIKDQRKALESYGFSFKERIKKHNISLLKELDKNPPRSYYDNIYLEPNGDKIKYTIITSSDNKIEGILDISIDVETFFSNYVSILFSSQLNNLARQSIETEILKELLKRRHISQFSNYKDYLGGCCILYDGDLLVMKKSGSVASVLVE